MRANQYRFLICLLLFWGMTCLSVQGQDDNDMRRNPKRRAKPQTAPQQPAPAPIENKPEKKPIADNSSYFTIKGVLLDGDSNEGLIGGGVSIPELGRGITTTVDGSFRLDDLPAGKYTLLIRYLGYNDIKKEIVIGNAPEIDLGNIRMETSDIGIEEVKIIANYADARQTPVATTSIDFKHIEENYTIAEDLPVVVRFAPSTYISRQGGGFGDSRISVRGFEQENLAVMINGVPINDMEFGKVYWVNFMGISDVTRNVQVQRGMGVSKLAVTSVGGTMNFITKTTDAEKGGSITVESANFLQRKTAFFNPLSMRTSLMLSTGLTEKKWAFTFQGSNVTGPGYFSNQFINFWSYFLSVSKQINDRHILVLTALGAPQSHGENLTPVPIALLDTFGRRYNPNWGFDRGQPKVGMNYYHKPQLNLNHYWTISGQTSVQSSVYGSWGTGGGIFTPFGPQTRDRQWNYDLMRQINSTGLDTVRDASGKIIRVGYQSTFYSNEFNLEQYWLGVISNLRHRVNEALTLTGGIDVRTFQGHQFFELNDLIGGDFMVDGADKNNPIKVARVGDKVWENKRSYIDWYGFFGQAEYKQDKVALFASFSSVLNTYKRKDYFRYLKGQGDVSVTKTIPSFSIKGGASYFPDSRSRLFLNGGYFTRAPFFGTVFAYSNEPAKDVVNEKIQSLEAGYVFTNQLLTLSLTGYLTQYQDKTQNIERVYMDGMQYSALIRGIQARHAGIEFDLNIQPLKWFSYQNFFSYGYWTYTDDLKNVTIANIERTDIRNITLFTKDLRVGNAPQLALGNSFTLRPTGDFYLSLDWFYYDLLFANFNLITRNQEQTKGKQPWQLPSYHLINLNAAYEFKMANYDATLRFAVNNLLNEFYFSEALDGINSDRNTAQVFAGYGQTFTLGLTVRWK
jgi:hypothetical protein